MVSMQFAISYTGTQCMDFVEIFNVSLDVSTFFLLILVDVELPLSIVVTLSQNAITCFLELSLV